MDRVSYHNIEALIAVQEVRGKEVHVTFRCPSTGHECDASARLSRSAGIQSTVERSVKKGLWSSLRRTVSSTIKDTVGTGMVGRIAKDVANKTMAEKQKSSKHTAEEVRDAIVAAFVSVQAEFRWDEVAEGWVWHVCAGASGSA